MLSFLKKVFRRKEPSSVEVPILERFPMEDTDEWKNVKVYDRSNSERKQLYYEGSYLGSCSSEEAKDTKVFIVECLLDGVPIETIKESL